MAAAADEDGGRLPALAPPAPAAAPVLRREFDFPGGPDLGAVRRGSRESRRARSPRRIFDDLPVAGARGRLARTAPPADDHAEQPDRLRAGVPGTLAGAGETRA